MEGAASRGSSMMAEGPQKLPDYNKPPVDEVYCSLAFRRLSTLRLHHIGLLRDAFRSEFPKIEYAPLISAPPDKIDIAEPFARIWLIAETNDRLVQFQSDRFLFNWRRQPEGSSYPHYAAVIEAFQRTLGLFRATLKEIGVGEIEPIECEMSYINTIPKGDGWEQAGQLGDILPDLTWRNDPKRFLPTPKRQNWGSVFALPENYGELRAQLQFGTRKIDMVEILRLELKANGMGDDPSDAGLRNWFDMAHEWIVQGFADLMAPDVQQAVWERIQ